MWDYQVEINQCENCTFSDSDNILVYNYGASKRINKKARMLQVKSATN